MIISLPNKLKALAAFLLLFFYSQTSSAQQHEMLPPRLDDFLTEIEQIYLNKDAEQRASVYVEDGVHVTGWGEAIKGKDAIQKLYENVFARQGLITKAEAVPVDVALFGEYATIRGKFIWAGESKEGKPFSMEMHMAAHFKKVNGEWKLVWDLTGPEVAKDI